MTAHLAKIAPPIRIIFRETLREIACPAPVLNPARVRFIQSAAFTRCDAWMRLRYDFMRDHEGLCRCCGRGAADGNRINVDHVLPRRTHPQLALAYGNLQILCSACNRGKGNRDRTDWRFRPSVRSAPPLCGACNLPMIGRSGPRGTFWGCVRFPRCRATRPADERAPNNRRPRRVSGKRPRRQMSGAR